MGEIAEAFRRSTEIASKDRNAARRRATSLRLVTSPTATREDEAKAPDPQRVYAAAKVNIAAQTVPAAMPPRRSAHGVPRAKISKRKVGPWQARVGHVEDASRATEAFRHFAIRLNRELSAKRVNTVLITSASVGEGRTTTACNLALALASLSPGKRVALVDLDLRAPSLGNALRIMPKVGLEDVLAGKAPLCASQIRTDHPSLDVFLVKESRERAHELLVSEKLAQSIIELSGHYGTVIFDSPPALPVPDANIIAQQVGACVPIARAGVTRLAAFDSMRKALPAEKIIGAFLNKAYLEPVDCSYDK